MPDEETTFEEMVATGEEAETTAVAEPEGTTESAAAEESTGDDTTHGEGAEVQEGTDETEEAGGEAEDDGSFMVDLAKSGYDFQAKYGTPEAALEAIGHREALLGQRHEDAQITKALRERMGDEAFERLVAGKAADLPADQQAAPEGPGIPASFDDMVLAQQAAEQEGASPEVRQRAVKMLTAYQQRLHHLASQPETVVSEAQVFKDLQARIDALEETTTETSSRAAEQTWGAQHSAELYVAGTGELTPLGKRTQGLLESDPDVLAIPDRVPQLNMALRLARGSLPKPRRIRTVPKGAQHQAGTNRGKDDLRTLEEQMEADLEADPDKFFHKYLGAGKK